MLTYSISENVILDLLWPVHRLLMAPVHPGQFLFAFQVFIVSGIYYAICDKMWTNIVAGRGPYYQSNRQATEEVYIPTRQEKQAVAGGCKDIRLSGLGK